MTPAALYTGARKAMKLAHECRRDGEAFEALRHRERAIRYLKSRASLMRDIHPPKMDQAA